MSFLSLFDLFPSNKARSSLSPAAATPAPTIKEQGKMNPFQLPEDAAASAAQAALEERPPGVDPESSPNFVASFSGANHGSSLPPLTSFLRRPAGLPASQVGQGIDTPRGSTTPLSAAFSRQVAATAAGPDVVDVPPPGTTPFSYT